MDAVLAGRVKDQGDRSALDSNVTVMQILDAARESARTGLTVRLHGRPTTPAQQLPRTVISERPYFSDPEAAGQSRKAHSLL